MNLWKSDFYNLIGGYDSSHWTCVITFQSGGKVYPWFFGHSVGSIYFTWSTQLSSVECTLPKIEIIFPFTVSHSFCSTLRVDLKQNHCDLALFRLVNLVQSFVSAVQSGRHKELGRPGKFQQTLPSDSLKLQTLSQHFWSTCLKRCFYRYIHIPKKFVIDCLHTFACPRRTDPPGQGTKR